MNASCVLTYWMRVILNRMFHIHLWLNILFCRYHVLHCLLSYTWQILLYIAFHQFLSPTFTNSFLKDVCTIEEAHADTMGPMRERAPLTFSITFYMFYDFSYYWWPIQAQQEVCQNRYLLHKTCIFIFQFFKIAIQHLDKQRARAAEKHYSRCVPISPTYKHNHLYNH